MLTYPNIDPVAVSLGPLKVHWYGLMYLLAFLCAWGSRPIVQNNVMAGPRKWFPIWSLRRSRRGAGWTCRLCTVLRVRQISCQSDLAVSGLDRRYEFSRRLYRRDVGHDLVVPQIPENLV